MTVGLRLPSRSSGRPPFIMMVETSDLGERNHLPHRWFLNQPGLRTVHPHRKMRENVAQAYPGQLTEIPCGIASASSKFHSLLLPQRLAAQKLHVARRIAPAPGQRHDVVHLAPRRCVGEPLRPPMAMWPAETVRQDAGSRRVTRSGATRWGRGARPCGPGRGRSPPPRAR